MIMDDPDDDLPNIPRITPPRTRAQTPTEEPSDPGDPPDPDPQLVEVQPAQVDQGNA